MMSRESPSDVRAILIPRLRGFAKVRLPLSRANIVANDLEQEFLRACGGVGPLRLSVEASGGMAAEPRDCAGPFAIVGRDPRSDVVLDHHDVGKRHAYLQLIGGRLFFVDLGSRSGVHRGEAKVRSGWLGPGEAIRIGPFALRAPEARGRRALRGPGSILNPLEATGDLADDRPEMTLEFLRTGSEFVAWRMNRVLVLIGRSSECRVRLEGSGVSLFHCSLLRTHRGLWAVDLLGRGGVRVDGRPARFARIGEGSEFRVGSHRIRLQSGTPPAVVGTLPALHGGQGTPMTPPAFTTFGATTSDRGQVSGLPGLSDSLLGHMTGQFGLIQQQMFDQFQQTMMMMAQMFGALHRDQADSVRAELDRLRQLNQDLAVLQGELIARRGATSPPAADATTPPTLESPRGPVDARVTRSSFPQRREADGAVSADALHSQINGRIAEIQEERQGRWQRLIDLMMSRSSGGHMP